MTVADTYTMKIEMTHYYPEFLRYFELAKDQQSQCNLGTIPYQESQMGDALLENVELYDVVERKYAGFSQIVNDVFYGWSDEHPYWHKMQSGHHTKQRKTVATKNKRSSAWRSGCMFSCYTASAVLESITRLSRPVTITLFCSNCIPLEVSRIW